MKNIFKFNKIFRISSQIILFLLVVSIIVRDIRDTDFLTQVSTNPVLIRIPMILMGIAAILGFLYRKKEKNISKKNYYLLKMIGFGTMVVLACLSFLMIVGGVFVSWILFRVSVTSMLIDAQVTPVSFYLMLGFVIISLLGWGIYAIKKLQYFYVLYKKA